MSALDEVLAALATAEELLQQAQRELAAGRSALDEASQALDGLELAAPATAVPAGLQRAGGEVERVQGLLDEVSDAVRGFAAGL
ncbi:hypothetical protein [Saccharopolyspora rectivirgula]|uniref:Uncharacterized protein n=1 Tax=Saccharopolyspora rectivirgula TaxID=28042 RepID=A0A073BCJ3_9PSEU|nr:hypothetical protein [Saccharopolyspora rectivirgula]KEI45494.1 hypothetical protein GU90_03355 [Saccharopolyspora rectivirgula]